MMKILVLAALAVFSTGTALAADVITLPAKNGNVSFPHKKHQELIKDCKACHKKGPGKIAGFGKDMAHKLCIDCHKAKGKGPVTSDCVKCHKK
jgi:predicted CXXCH cytochrome family protein